MSIAKLVPVSTCPLQRFYIGFHEQKKVPSVCSGFITRNDFLCKFFLCNQCCLEKIERHATVAHVYNVTRLQCLGFEIQIGTSLGHIEHHARNSSSKLEPLSREIQSGKTSRVFWSGGSANGLLMTHAAVGLLHGFAATRVVLVFADVVVWTKKCLGFISASRASLLKLAWKK